MTSDHRADVPQSSESISQTVQNVRDQVSGEEPVHNDQEHEQTPSDHFGAVEGETTFIIPPMRGATDRINDSATDDLIDPDDEITPG